MKPQLESATFNFSQDGNCLSTNNTELLEIRCESSLGIDRDDGCFYVIKTEGWSIDNVQELKELFDRIQKSIERSKPTEASKKGIDQRVTEYFVDL